MQTKERTQDQVDDDIRKLGQVVDLQGKTLIDLSPDELYNNVAKELFKNGVILIPNQEKLSLNDFIEVTSRFGSLVKLPKQLGFNNIQQELPEIVRVGNMSNEGKLMDQYVAAEYWHADGEFWPETRNYILNVLFSHLVPDHGGETAFFDMQKLYYSLKEQEKQKFEKSHFEVNIELIPDFKGVDPKALALDEIAKHQTVNTNPFTGKKSIYLGGGYSEVNYPDGSKESASNLIEKYCSDKNQWYIHSWKKGDILLWDNTQVMHRGMGGYFNSPRLLYRTQARLTPFHLKKLLRFIK